MCICPIVVFIDFSICFLNNQSVRPGHVLRKPNSVSLRRLVFKRLKSDARKYCASSGLVVWYIILSTTTFGCCVSRGTFQIPIFLFLVTFIICCPFFTVVNFWSIVMVHLLSHNIPNDNSGAILIFGKMRIFLACFLAPGIWSVYKCDNSIVIPSGRIDVMSFNIITGDIFGMACFSGCIFAPESAIASVYLLEELGGVPILLMKLILWVLILTFFHYLSYPLFAPLFTSLKSFLVLGLLFVAYFLVRAFFSPVSEIYPTAPTVTFTLCYCCICWSCI